MTGVIATTEATLCRIFADVLGLDLVRPGDAFFDVGGDSVLALQVVTRTRAAGLALSVRDLFDRQTPAELAAVTAELPGGSPPRADAVPPLLLSLTADELEEFEDTGVGFQAGGPQAEWEEAE